jgi:hypothetical protein
VIPGYIFEPSDQKARSFVVTIIFNRLFFRHVHKLFGEMIVRIRTDFDPIFIVSLACVLVSIDSCFRCDP